MHQTLKILRRAKYCFYNQVVSVPKLAISHIWKLDFFHELRSQTFFPGLPETKHIGFVTFPTCPEFVIVQEFQGRLQKLIYLCIETFFFLGIDRLPSF